MRSIIQGTSLFFKVILLLTTALTVLMSIRYLKEEGFEYGEYYILLLFAAVGMMLMASAADLIMIFLGLETFSLSIYVLAGFFRTQPKSNESSLKYFLLGAFSTAFLLYGIALLYGATGSTNLSAIAAAIRTTSLFQNPLLLLSMGLILIGFGLIGFILLGGRIIDLVNEGYAYRDFTMSERMLTQLRVVLHYLTLLIFPISSRLNLDYDFQVSKSLFDPQTTQFFVFRHRLQVMYYFQLFLKFSRVNPRLFNPIVLIFIKDNGSSKFQKSAWEGTESAPISAGRRFPVKAVFAGPYGRLSLPVCHSPSGDRKDPPEN
jgi:hypothetical protein